MSNSVASYTGNGVITDFSVPFPYLATSHIQVTVNGITTAYTWANSSTVRITPAPAVATAIVVKRVTSSTPIVTFIDGSTLVASDLNIEGKQAIYLAQEAVDASTDIVANSAILNVAVTAAQGSATAAATSAYNAAIYAGNALSSANAASTNGSTQVGLAAAQVALAAAQATAAAASAITAAGYVVPAQAGNGGKVLSTNGTVTSWQTIGNLVWVIKNTVYTLVSHDAIQANTSGGAFTLTLPATPTANDVVNIADYAGTFGTNNLTIGRNGSNIMGLAEDMLVPTSNISFSLTYIDATRGWSLA
jgi:hypothetical protein